MGMTRNEAIENLKQLKLDYENFYDETSEALDMAISSLKTDEAYVFPDIIGESCEMYVDGIWIKGKIVDGYRFRDGMVTIEDANGQRYSCGQARTDLYRKGC